MKVYVTVIPDPDRELDDANRVKQEKKFFSVLKYTVMLMNESILTRFVLTNMPRDRIAEFRKASEI